MDVVIVVAERELRSIISVLVPDSMVDAVDAFYCSSCSHCDPARPVPRRGKEPAIM